MANARENKYWIPILRVLDKLGGSAPIDMIMERLLIEMKSILLPKDYEELPKSKTGEIRWENAARFARQDMKEAGLLRSDSVCGVWEYTEAGKAHLKEHEWTAGKSKSMHESALLLEECAYNITSSISQALDKLSVNNPEIEQTISMVNHFTSELAGDIKDAI